MSRGSFRTMFELVGYKSAICACEDESLWIHPSADVEMDPVG